MFIITEGLCHDNPYHPSKANVLVHALSRLSMGSTSNIEEETRKLAKGMHKLEHLGIKLMDSTEVGLVVMNGSESSSLLKVKENQVQDPIFMN